jgi:superfamily II DNA or RNA helicase
MNLEDLPVPTVATSQPDPFLYDMDRLQTVASEPIVRRGIAYHRELRVTDLDWDGSRVWARVEGSRGDMPYFVELSRDHDGELSVSCDCPFDWEPVCKHAVAVLLSYSARFGDISDSNLVGAAAVAVQERSQRGRTEVTVEHVAGEPGFGLWRATSLATTGQRHRSYTVHVRSVEAKRNYCTCPDWASNQLGTCKHIEAVLHRLKKDHPAWADVASKPPHPFIYLAWDRPGGPEIRVETGAISNTALEEWLATYFDVSGRFVGELPDDFFRFQDEMGDRSDLLIGEDVCLHVRQIAEDAAQAQRAERLRAEILRSGGSLPGVRARLYPYQVEGVAFLASRGRALLADDMGLGKTLQTIAAATWLQHNREVRQCLVVCPASLKHQWAREIARFTDQAVQVIQGNPKARAALYRQQKAFVVMNYELVMRDQELINELLRPDLLVLDEAQRVKNWRTKVATAIKSIESRYAFVLTGTPLENRLEDLYSLMQVVDHRVLGPLWRYLIDFHVTDERGKVIGYRNLSELRRRLAPVMLRRNRSLVIDQLPERTELRLDVPMTPKQWDLHDTAMMSAGTLAKLAKRRPLTPSEQNRLMAALQQARMACNAAGLVDGETVGAPKLDELERILEDVCLQEGQKVVVFSQWERMTQMAERVATGLGLGCVRLHGGVPTSQRGALLDRYRDDAGIQVFISTDAGGVGLNLQSASVLVNLDMPWNPAVLEQRIARIHRLGQGRKVRIVLMVAQDAYEERVAHLIRNKRDLFDNVVEPTAEEDVVGVSKRTLDALIEDLDADRGGPSHRVEAGEAAQNMADREADEGRVGAAGDDAEDPGADAMVRDCVAAIQREFGSRVERIMGTGGGLLVVLDRMDDAAQKRVDTLGSETLPVAAIDTRALYSLQRLGAGSPLAAASTHYEATANGDEGSHLLRLAREKLEAAEQLGEGSAAMELLASAMIAAASARAERQVPPERHEIAVWLYSEVVPKGLLGAEQAGRIMLALSLSMAPEVPAALLRLVYDDARSLVAMD